VADGSLMHRLLSIVREFTFVGLEGKKGDTVTLHFGAHDYIIVPATD
jgi:hypothetical protein